MNLSKAEVFFMQSNTEQSISIVTLPDNEFDRHTPNSFVVAKDILNFRQGLITQAGLETQVITFLKERAQLALDEFDMEVSSDGKLYNPQFKEPLTQLYAKPCGDPIYDARAPFDTNYITQIENWVNTTEANFTWARFSPTTGAMSRETKVELGRREGSNLHVIVLTIPFQDNQTRDEAFLQIKNIASLFNPSFANAINEFDMLDEPVLLEKCPVASSLIQDNEVKRDLVIKVIDMALSASSKSSMYMGRSDFSLSDQQRFLGIADLLKEQNILGDYVAAIASGLHEDEVIRYFNSIVNNFDSLWAQTTALPTEIYFKPDMPVFIASGCGGYGERVQDIIASGIRLPERASGLDLLYPKDFGDPHTGVCGGEGNKNGGCGQLAIVGGCELCVNCHHKYASAA